MLIIGHFINARRSLLRKLFGSLATQRGNLLECLGPMTLRHWITPVLPFSERIIEFSNTVNIISLYRKHYISKYLFLK